MQKLRHWEAEWLAEVCPAGKRGMGVLRKLQAALLPSSLIFDMGCPAISLNFASFLPTRTAVLGPLLTLPPGFFSSVFPYLREHHTQDRTARGPF